MCFYVFTGSVPNCRASSRAWWEEPRRGRCLGGKCRRERGKPEDQANIHSMDFKYVCESVRGSVFINILKCRHTPWMCACLCVIEGDTSLFLNCSIFASSTRLWLSMCVLDDASRPWHTEQMGEKKKFCQLRCDKTLPFLKTWINIFNIV